MPERLDQALTLLDRLGERTKNIFILFRLQGMRREEIVALYGIALSEVDRHIVLAMVELVKLDGPE